MSKIDHRLGRPLRTQKSPQKAVQVYISENDFAHLVTVFCMVIIQNARRPRAPGSASQGGLGEVSRAITQVFLVTHFTSGEPALVIRKVMMCVPLRGESGEDEKKTRLSRVL